MMPLMFKREDSRYKLKLGPEQDLDAREYPLEHVCVDMKMILPSGTLAYIEINECYEERDKRSTVPCWLGEVKGQVTYVHGLGIVLPFSQRAAFREGYSSSYASQLPPHLFRPWSHNSNPMIIDMDRLMWMDRLEICTSEDDINELFGQFEPRFGYNIADLLMGLKAMSIRLEPKDSRLLAKEKKNLIKRIEQTLTGSDAHGAEKQNLRLLLLNDATNWGISQDVKESLGFEDMK